MKKGFLSFFLFTAFALALCPARSASHLTKRKNIPRATSARTSLKKKPACLCPARSASHLTKRKNQPRATSARTCLKKN